MNSDNTNNTTTCDVVVDEDVNEICEGECEGESEGEREGESEGESEGERKDDEMETAIEHGLDNTITAGDLLNVTELTRQRLKLHHEAQIIRGYVEPKFTPALKSTPASKSMSARAQSMPKTMPKFRPQFAKFAKLDTRSNMKITAPDQKITHYQGLSDQLANWIVTNSKEKIISATMKAHGWTNIYQYLPTNHPSGIAQIMPMLSASKASVWSSIPKSDQQDLLKYFAGIDIHGMPIKSTKENDGVPVILLIQGPKIGATRSLDCLRAQGLNPVMDQLNARFGEAFPGVTVVHRWVGKNGYIIEAVWDHEGYQNRIDAKDSLGPKPKPKQDTNQRVKHDALPFVPKMPGKTL